MVKSTLRPWMPPVTGPPSILSPPLTATAPPEAAGPVELKNTCQPSSCLIEKSPTNAYWLQGGARGSGNIGPACAGAGTARNPTALIAVAAANNWDLFMMVTCDIGILSISGLRR